MKRKLFSLFSCAFVAVIFFSGCEKEKRGPVNITAQEGKSTVKAVMGKEGGRLQFGDKGARLEVPAGLLQEDITITFKREKPSFDLSGKDYVGGAYRISPQLTFAPGTARLLVPVDRALPGLPADINLKMYYYERLESDGPAGPSFVHTWQPYSLARFTGFSQDRKFMKFELPETISSHSTKAPFGLFQAGFNMK